MRRSLIPLILLALPVIYFAGCVPKFNKQIKYRPDQISYAKTDDGWKLVVYHLPPSAPRKDALPIIMCHGFTSTSVTFDQGDGLGLGPYLAARGYDVWLVNLRGHAPDNSPIEDQRKPYGWTVDDYIHHDVPALIDHVCRQTGARQVTWIAHSMGGIVAYGYLGSSRDQRVARMIAVASPVRFADYNDLLQKLIVWLKPENGLTIHYMGRFASAEPSTTYHKYEMVVINPENIDRKKWRRYLDYSLTDISGGVALQLADWTTRDVMVSRDGNTDYRREMKNIKFPLLVIAGQLDGLAPPAISRPALDWVGSDKKEFKLIGLASGAQTDYGHLDLLIGPRVEQEVFPTIADWLAQ